jgi:transcriptional antiterminator RfaH
MEPSFEENSSPSLAWFCLRSQPKHEHIAAAHLRSDARIETFLPRIRFRRATRRGSVWVTEALFPNYLFARFDWQQSLRHVQHIRGVQTVVHFGIRWPTIADETIAALRSFWADQEVHTVSDQLTAGEEVRIISGPMQGLHAVVSRPLPARERVAVLLDFLGRQTAVEVALENVVRTEDPRSGLQTSGGTKDKTN